MAFQRNYSRNLYRLHARTQLWKKTISRSRKDESPTCLSMFRPNTLRNTCNRQDPNGDCLCCRMSQLSTEYIGERKRSQLSILTLLQCATYTWQSFVLPQSALGGRGLAWPYLQWCTLLLTTYIHGLWGYSVVFTTLSSVGGGGGGCSNLCPTVPHL